MPAEIFGDAYEFLPRSRILRFEEIERLARIFAGLGVNKIRITGGEPLLPVGLPELIERLARIDGIDDLALTTNATLLPRLAPELARVGLSRVTVSLDAIDNGIFREMNGDTLSVDRVLAGIEAAEAAGLGPLKVNAVVQRGVNDGEVVALARHFRGTRHIVRFIEYMDVGTRNRWDLSQVLPAGEVVDRIAAEFPLEPLDANYPGEVAKRWRYVDGQGEIGVIASVTQPFCGACTRVRLTTEGQLVTCLFAAGGTDLREPLRDGASDDTLREKILAVWGARRDRYSEERAGLLESGGERGERIEMYQIGG